LRIRQEELLPVFERLGDVRSKAVTMGKIADILQARGQLDEALRIRQEEELPVLNALAMCAQKL
jgi:phosphopentomutase